MYLTSRRNTPEAEQSSTRHSCHRSWSFLFSSRCCLHPWPYSFSPVHTGFHQPMRGVKRDCPCCGQSTGGWGGGVLQRVSWRPGGMWRKRGSVGRRHVDSTVGGKAGLETVPLSLDNVHNVSAPLTWLDFFLCHLVGNSLVRISLHSADRFSEVCWIAVSDSRFPPVLRTSVADSLPFWNSQLSCSQASHGIN